MKNAILFSVVALFLLCSNVKATTWFPAERSCPLCHKKNTYQEIGSYGSYIYSWPSKYQYVYWPLTEEQSVYCCIDCHYATLMWDFDTIPVEKTEPIKNMLKTITLDLQYKDYMDIPIITRLEIAEKVYLILGRDLEFWCKFYRVMGYHYDFGTSRETNHFGGKKEAGIDRENDKAMISRRKSLNLAMQMLNDTAYTGKEKENLFIIGAMYNFTGAKDSAMVYLEKSKKYSYSNKNWKEDNVKGFNEYLNELVDSYLAILNKKEKE